MAVIIKIPTWATFNRFPQGTPTQGLGAVESLLQLPAGSLSVGSVNPVWPDLQDLDLGGGPLVRGATMNDLSTVTPIENAAFLTLSHVGLAVGIGGDVDGYAGFLAIDPDAEVPENLPNRTYVDESEQEQVHTWRSWFEMAPGPNNYPQEIDGSHYVPNSNFWGGGAVLPASIWLPLVMAGTPFLTPAQYIELTAE